MQQPLNRVSHVVYCLRPESLDRVTEFFRSALDVELEDASRPELGLRIFVSLASGIELISPAPDLGPTPERFTQFLDEHGEGVYDVVFGVDDLDAASERAERHGASVTHRGSFAHVEPWAGRFDALDEAHLEPFDGVRLTLGRIVPAPR
jgi:methylmalonyl-CoA/ethylmalonyl-CoA epimerase